MTPSHSPSTGATSRNSGFSKSEQGLVTTPNISPVSACSSRSSDVSEPKSSRMIGRSACSPRSVEYIMLQTTGTVKVLPCPVLILVMNAEGGTARRLPGRTARDLVPSDSCAASWRADCFDPPPLLALHPFNAPSHAAVDSALRRDAALDARPTARPSRTTRVPGDKTLATHRDESAYTLRFSSAGI